MSAIEAARTTLRAITTRKALAQALGVPYPQLIYYVYRRSREAQYVVFEVPKRNGGTRSIAAPSLKLKAIQRAVSKLLGPAYNPKLAAHGFQTGRNVMSNATPHVRARAVLNFDLQDFFPTITFARIRGMLLAKPYLLCPDIATTIAQICTYHDTLPQGAPTSPLIANMICGKLDGELSRYAKRAGAYYTRYADDITFSTRSHRLPNNVCQWDEAPRSVVLADDLRRVIEGNGFQINARKTRLAAENARQVVTGVLVNRFPNLPREFLNEVRAMLYAWRKWGLAGAEKRFGETYQRRAHYPGAPAPRFREVLGGKIAYVGMIRGSADPYYLTFIEQFEALEQGQQWVRKKKPTVHEILRSTCWVLECDESSRQGTAFVLDGVGLVTCAHVLGPSTVAFHPDSQGVRFHVKVLRKSDDIDLAVLEIPKPGAALQRDVAGKPLNYEDHVRVAGYPNFRPADQIYACSGRVVGIRTVSAIRRLLTDAPIVAGNSGGPVLNEANLVIGVAATGADRMEKAALTEDHGIIPISALEMF
jgi:S1-C subfamily serine protease